jgi:protein MpaA
MYRGTPARSLSLLIALPVLLASCTPSVRHGAAPPVVVPWYTIEPLGWSVEGQAIEAWVFPGDRPPVLIVGGIHGNEPASAALVVSLLPRWIERPESRSGRMVVLVPWANPDGLAAGTRTNARGVDLNRNFRTRTVRGDRRHGGLPESEPETRALVAALDRYRPVCVVSVHGPLRCVDPDGPASSRRLAEKMAGAGGMPVRNLPAHPGSMGTYVGVERGVTMITYELDRRRLPPENTVDYLGPHQEAMETALRGAGPPR